MSKRCVSLSNELHIIIASTRAAKGIAEQLVEGSLDATSDERHRALVAQLALLIERLRLLDRVVRGTVDARLLRCPENEATTFESSDEDDVHFEDWGKHARARHHVRERKRTKSS